MSEPYPFHTNIEVRLSPSRGRGIFAKRPFAAGEEIEVSPVFPIGAAESEAIRPLSFSHNLFDWVPLSDGTWSLAVVTGLGMLFNHSYTPNADYDRDEERMALVFTAIKPISIGEEIFINYNGDPDAKDPLWFEVE